MVKCEEFFWSGFLGGAGAVATSSHARRVSPTPCETGTSRTSKLQLGHQLCPRNPARTAPPRLKPNLNSTKKRPGCPCTLRRAVALAVPSAADVLQHSGSSAGSLPHSCAFPGASSAPPQGAGQDRVPQRGDAPAGPRPAPRRHLHQDRVRHREDAPARTTSFVEQAATCSPGLPAQR